MASGSNLTSARPRRRTRCGHYEQVKIGSSWKCVACGQILTVAESIQNSLELADAMRSAIDSKRTLSESLDEMLGRKEWEEIRTKIPTGKEKWSRKAVAQSGPKRRKRRTRRDFNLG